MMIKAPKTEEELRVFLNLLRKRILIERIQLIIDEFIVKNGFSEEEMKALLGMSHRDLKMREIPFYLQRLNIFFPKLYSKIVEEIRNWI